MEQPHTKPLLPVLDRGKGWPTNDFVCEKWIGLEIHEALGGSRRMPNKRESERAQLKLSAMSKDQNQSIFERKKNTSIP